MKLSIHLNFSIQTEDRIVTDYLNMKCIMGFYKFISPSIIMIDLVKNMMFCQILEFYILFI